MCQIKNYKARNKAAWRQLVLLKDNFTCQKCGKKDIAEKLANLQAHHIKSTLNYPDLELDISNGQTLCIKCHNQMPKVRLNYSQKVNLEWALRTLETFLDEEQRYETYENMNIDELKKLYERTDKWKKIVVTKARLGLPVSKYGRASWLFLKETQIANRNT